MVGRFCMEYAQTIWEYLIIIWVDQNTLWFFSQPCWVKPDLVLNISFPKPNPIFWFNFLHLKLHNTTSISDNFNLSLGFFRIDLLDPMLRVTITIWYIKKHERVKLRKRLMPVQFHVSHEMRPHFLVGYQRWKIAFFLASVLNQVCYVERTRVVLGA